MRGSTLLATVALALTVGCGNHRNSRPTVLLASATAPGSVTTGNGTTGTTGTTAAGSTSGTNTTGTTSGTNTGSATGPTSLTSTQPVVRVGYRHVDGTVDWVAAQLLDLRQPGEYVGGVEIVVPPQSATIQPNATLQPTSGPAAKVSVKLGMLRPDGTVAWEQPTVVDNRQPDGVVRRVDVYVPDGSWSSTPAP